MYFTYICAYVFYFLLLDDALSMLHKVGKKTGQAFSTSIKDIVTSTNSGVTEGIGLYVGWSILHLILNILINDPGKGQSIHSAQLLMTEN